MNDIVNLSWQTASELNNQGFVIQRSNDNMNWENIGFVNGAGNSNLLKEYSYNDNNPEEINYYRLKQLDYDGKVNLSDVKYYRKAIVNDISIYPNPASNSFKLLGVSSSDIDEVVVYNAVGSMVLTITNDFNTIDISSLHYGIYFIRIYQLDGSYIIRKFIKE